MNKLRSFIAIKLVIKLFICAIISEYLILAIKEKSMKKERQSNIEVLRILSMLMIIGHHFALHGRFNYSQYNAQLVDVEKVLVIFQAFGKVGVDIFVLIGAYFLVGRKYKSSRIVNLLLVSTFYSTAIYIIFLIFHLEIRSDFVNENLWLPFPGVSSYWFVWSYIVMLIFMPVLNIALENMTKRQLQCFLIGLSILWILIPQLNTYFPGKLDFGVEYVGYSDGIFFIYLYLIAAYLKLYSSKITKNIYVNILILVLSLVAMYFSIVIPINESSINSSLYYLNSAMLQEHSALTVLAAIAIFNIFANINLGRIKFINWIAASTFAVYLIHDNSLVRVVLWGYVDNSKIKNAYDMFLYGIKEIILIFVICVAIDIIRRLLLGWLFNWLTQKIGGLLDKIILAK